MALGTRFLDAGGSVLAKITQKLGIAGTGEGVLHVANYPASLTTSDGAFSAAANSGTMAAGLASGSEIFQFRWTSATSTCQVQRVRISAQCAGTAFVAGVCNFNMKIARTWTADGSGGNSVTPSKRRASMAATALGAARISATGALTAGTKTLDTSHVGSIVASATTATTASIVAPGTVLWDRPAMDSYPILLVQNEGFVITAKVPGTGTWTFAVSVDWTETLLANY